MMNSNENPQDQNSQTKKKRTSKQFVEYVAAEKFRSKNQSQPQYEQKNMNLFEYIPKPFNLQNQNVGNAQQIESQPILNIENIFQPLQQQQQQQQNEQRQQQQKPKPHKLIRNPQQQDNNQDLNITQQGQQGTQESNNNQQVNPLNNKKKSDKKEKKDKKDKLKNNVEEGFENAKWRCRVCNSMNKWTCDKACQICDEFKYREYDRMRKDIGQNDYRYLFFVDFECNSSYKYGFEIIEFPLHVIDTNTLELLETFSTYVKPSTQITKFITKLTKIQNHHVQNAPILQEVLINCQYFLEKYLEAGLDKCVIVFDCDSDSSFLFNEVKKKNLKLPQIFDRYISLKAVFPATISDPPRVPASLSKMLNTLKMEFQGQKHCGTDDSKNQALVGIELLRRGYNFSKKQEIKLGQGSNIVSQQLKKEKYQEYKQEYLQSIQQQKQQQPPQNPQQEEQIEEIQQQLNDINLNI